MAEGSIGQFLLLTLSSLGLRCGDVLALAEKGWGCQSRDLIAGALFSPRLDYGTQLSFHYDEFLPKPRLWFTVIHDVGAVTQPCEL